MVQICIAVASNDHEILNRNLLASELSARPGIELVIEKQAKSASIAYNKILDQSQAEIVIFAHQDVYFPPGWYARLQHALKAVGAANPDWAAIAPTGISQDDRHVGQVWSSSQGSIVGQHSQQPVPAQSFDELCIILRRSSSVRFDEAAPGFHMFGTDIVQTALAAGKGAYICDLPLVHNDVFHAQLGSDFGEAYDYIRHKWTKCLPLKTTVLNITRSGMAWPLYRLKAAKSVVARGAKASDHRKNPKYYSRICDWEKHGAICD